MQKPQQNLHTKKTSLLPLFLTIFIDLVGVGIIIPILAPLIFNPAGGILPFATMQATRAIVLGFLVATYPLAQFFAAPILGALADRYGRKNLLLISLVGTYIGYLIFAVGIIQGSLLILFLSRALDGFTGGNISIALSSIADMSDEKTKARNFGLIGMAFGLGFILGPYIGGKLGDPSVVSWFNPATPFFFAATLTALNILFLSLKFNETLRTRIDRPLSLLTGPRNIIHAFSMTNLRVMFTVSFLLAFGFNFFTQFFPVFLIQKFSYTQSQIGDLFSYIGLWVAFAQGLIMRPLAKKFLPQQILPYSALFLSLTFPFLLIPDKAAWLFLVIPFIAIFNGLTYPNTNAIISNLSGPEVQGEVLGINQSLQSLAQAIPPIIAGFIIAINRNLPILVAGVLTFLSWLTFVLFFKKKKMAEKFHEVV